MRINGIWECPDADQEVGAKHIGDTERVQTASREPMPPLASEAGELGELNDEPMTDPTLALIDPANQEASNQDKEDAEDLIDEADDLALL